MIVKWSRSQCHRFLSNEASSVWLTLLLISAQLQRVVGNKHCQLNRQWELCGRRRNGIPCPLRQHPTRRARRPCVPWLSFGGEDRPLPLAGSAAQTVQKMKHTHVCNRA